LPAPTRGKKRPTHRFVFTFNAQAVQADEQYDGYSALVTTVPLDQASGDQLFRKYKEQIYSEHVNRQFKGPLAVHPLYLHTPERIEALVFLLAITLMLYCLLQHLYRQSVPANAAQRAARHRAATPASLQQLYALGSLHSSRSRSAADSPDHSSARASPTSRFSCSGENPQPNSSSPSDLKPTPPRKTGRCNVNQVAKYWVQRANAHCERYTASSTPGRTRRRARLKSTFRKELQHASCRTCLPRTIVFGVVGDRGDSSAIM